MSGDAEGDERHDVIPGAAGGPDENSGDRHPVVSRVRAKVNVPPPKTKTFGVGEPGFVKLPGRSPGAAPLAESGRRRGVGDLPGRDPERLPELSKQERRLSALARRWRAVGSLEKLLALVFLLGIALVVLLARKR